MVPKQDAIFGSERAFEAKEPAFKNRFIKI
jgi:hypothetical protein